jgi:Rod binding domain-containing protein
MITPLSNLNPALLAAPPAAPHAGAKAGDAELRRKFDQFVGQTFFGQMLSSMRQTVGKPAYLHGGRGEEIFRGQLDQVLSEELSERTAGQFSGPMFDLCMLPRS